MKSITIAKTLKNITYLTVASILLKCNTERVVEYSAQFTPEEKAAKVEYYNALEHLGTTAKAESYDSLDAKLYPIGNWVEKDTRANNNKEFLDYMSTVALTLGGLSFIIGFRAYHQARKEE